MASRNEAIRAIEGPLQDFVKNNTNIVCAAPYQITGADGPFGVEVGVVSLQEELRISALGLGGFAVPGKLDVRNDIAPQKVTEVRVTKFMVGKVRALPLIRPAGKCPPGYSIGHPRMSAGTFGCLLKWDHAPLHAFILSNQHVLAGNNVGRIGDPIYQPGRYDGGTAFHTIARLAAFINLDHISHNILDAALARVENDNTPPENWSDIVSPLPPFVESFTGFAAPTERMEVEFVGRTSEHGFGRVERLNSEAYPDYGPGLGVLHFRGQVRTSPMAQEGDSGSVVVESSTKKIVGLLFAGGPGASFFTPIQVVLAELAMKLGGGNLTLR